MDKISIYKEAIVDTMSYSEQLRNQKWRDKREEIVLERGGKCERCGSEKFLQVHHKKYLKNKLAWEYENDMLECLCGGCHMKEHGVTKETKEQEMLKEESMSYEEMIKICKMKTLIMLNMADPVVNKIICLSGVVRINTDIIYFRGWDGQISKYLKKKFGDKVKCTNGEIGFHINKCTGDKDFEKLNAEYIAKESK